MSEIHHEGFSGRQTGTLRPPDDMTWFEQGRETPEERRWREHHNQHFQLVTRREWLEGQKHDRRWETFLIVTGALFDAMVVILAVKEFLL